MWVYKLSTDAEIGRQLHAILLVSSVSNGSGITAYLLNTSNIHLVREVTKQLTGKVGHVVCHVDWQLLYVIQYTASHCVCQWVA